MFNRKQKVSQSDLTFLSDRNAAIMLKAPKGSRIILWSIFVFVMAAIVWAHYTSIDEVTVGEGTVVPSSQVQVIQNLEGGILKAISVRAGQAVEEGQLLMTIENTEAVSSLREQQVERMNLMARASRLAAEASGREPVFSQVMRQDYPEIVNREEDLYQNRQDSLRANQAVFQQQIAQREQEIVEQRAQLENFQSTYELASQELSLTRPAFESGAVSRVELLQLERQVNQLQGDLQASRLAIPRAQSALEEARTKLAESSAKFRADAQEQLTEVRGQLDQLRESSVSLEDKVDRTLVRSPVKGIVKQVQINTVGGVIKPGMSLMEIVPVDDSLLIEAKVRPEDVGFIKPDLPAMVKLTAYDFSIYGGLEAQVENISADTILDEEGNSYYLVKVRTNKNYLGTESSPLSIIPGMQSSVDIITGKKTVLDYLLKPIFKAQQNALRER